MAAPRRSRRNMETPRWMLSLALLLAQLTSWSSASITTGVFFGEIRFPARSCCVFLFLLKMRKGIQICSASLSVWMAACLRVVATAPISQSIGRAADRCQRGEKVVGSERRKTKCNNLCVRSPSKQISVANTILSFAVQDSSPSAWRRRQRQRRRHSLVKAIADQVSQNNTTELARWNRRRTRKQHATTRASSARDALAAATLDEGEKWKQNGATAVKKHSAAAAPGFFCCRCCSGSAGAGYRSATLSVCARAQNRTAPSVVEQHQQYSLRIRVEPSTTRALADEHQMFALTLLCLSAYERHM